MAEINALQVKDLESYYKDFQALWKVTLKVEEGAVVSIIGSNGAGKSTLLNSIAGLITPTHGRITFFGEEITGLSAHKILEKGISLVPEGRRVFSRLTVYENLLMGSYTPRARQSRNEGLSKLYDLFPVLKSRSRQMASTLSGGEQQMLAIARALMSEPKVILCDEISLGLAPLIIKDIYKRLKLINEGGLTIVLVEQDITRSLKAAQHAYVMLEGKIVLDGDPSKLTEDEVKRAYFGI